MTEYVPEPTYRISFMFRKILVPVDGSENSFRALDVAIDFAKRYGSKITVLYVVEQDINPDKVKASVAERLAPHSIQWEFKARRYSPATSSIANEIIQEVITGSYDLVIMGARGNTVNEELLVGSNTLSVIINAPSSIMIIR
ncbi:MAG: universal stress protein [Pyrodictiaceae archaeon]